MVAHDAVAFATCGFQALSFEDADPSMAARDQSSRWSVRSTTVHRRAMHAEHHRKEFLFEQKISSSTRSRVCRSHREQHWVTSCSDPERCVARI